MPTRTTADDEVADSTRPLLTKLELRNFRAFEAQAVDFAPLTIFVGPNNAGKSSVLSALRILSQTLQGVDWEVPLLLGGFGTFRDVVYGNKATRTFGMRLSVKRRRRDASFEVNFKYRAQRREIILQNFTAFDDERQPVLKTVYSRDSERQIIDFISSVGEDIAKQLRLRFFHFVPRMAVISFELQRIKDKKKLAFPTQKIREADLAISETTRRLQVLQYLGPFRDAPLRVYPFSGERPSILSPGGGGATDILVADYFRRGTRKRELSNSVQKWLSEARIASDLQVRAVSDRHYDIRLKHPVTGEVENLADVGCGVSQVLPVIVAGYNLETGSLFMVEQPEIHLHPSAQSELGNFFLELYKRGVQSIVETHSEHLILRVQKHVASGLIPPEDVAVNYVYAVQGKKKVLRLPLNRDGIFTTEWPQGFFEERLSEALDLARAPLIRDGELTEDKPQKHPVAKESEGTLE